ncbi:MAG: hypothetical protein ABUK08_05920, partial [Candidatus Humimicrobiaceae bacterium]
MDKEKNNRTAKEKKPAEGKKFRFKMLPRYGRILIITFSAILFAAAVAAAVFFIYINSINNTINSLNSAEVENILTPIESPEEPVTILILGRDSRDTEDEKG